jgi:hypothetical protein
MGIVSDDDIENINLNVVIPERGQKFQNKIVSFCLELCYTQG